MEISIKKEKNAEIIAHLDCEVQKSHNEYYPELFKPYDYETSFNLYKQSLESPRIHCFIAYNAEIPVGFALIAEQSILNHPLLNDRKEIFIDTIVVQKKYESQGIGKKLLEEIKKFTTEINLKRITLNVWDKNTHAVNFYQKNGFKEIFSSYELHLD